MSDVNAINRLDFFAASALKGLLAGDVQDDPDFDGDDGPLEISRLAYYYADAMQKVRDEPSEFRNAYGLDDRETYGLSGPADGYGECGGCPADTGADVPVAQEVKDGPYYDPGECGTPENCYKDTPIGLDVFIKDGVIIGASNSLDLPMKFRTFDVK